MNRMMKKFRLLWRRRQLDRDLEDELRFHLDMKTEELGDRAEAQRRIGNISVLKEVCRELWIFSNLETCWQDIRYAARTLSATPGFTLAAIVALGLGIGADTAVFTIADGALRWNLGLEHLDRTVIVGLTDGSPRSSFGVSYPDFADLRAQTKSLAGLAGYQFASVNLSDSKTFPQRCWAARMSANGFAVSEQKPALGRAFMDADERPGAPAVVVLTDHIWQDRYGSDPAILGKTIRIDDVPVTVIGVMPPGKRFPEETDMWLPLIPSAQTQQRGNRELTLFGRLAAGVDLNRARGELRAIVARLAKQYPETNEGLTADVQSIAMITGVYNMRPVLIALWVAIGFVLLIACADVANMLLARGAGRMREISIRVAIGAGRARIVRQLLIESVLLSAAGGLLGWWVALGGLRWFDAGTGGMVKPVWLNLSLDRTAFLYLAAVSIATGILFGLAPALRLANIDVHTAMKDGGQAVAGSRRVLSLSTLLIAFEAALCMILLAGAGLMIRSALNLYGAPIGVDSSNILTMRINLPQAKYPSPADEMMFHATLNQRLRALAGVESAAVVSNLPFGSSVPIPYELEGSPVESGRAPRVGAVIASADYFRVMRLHPRRGRIFSDLDGIAAPGVLLVNESFARTFWPGADALGKHVRLIAEHRPQPWFTVVGVLPDVLQNFQHPLQHDPLLYIPYSELPLREISIVARTKIRPGLLADSFRRAVQRMDGNLAVYDVRSLEDRLDQNRLSAKLLSGMFSVFAAIALMLAAVGLYAVMAHSISQRTQEIGLRMALGASRRDMMRLVYTQAMRPMALGLALGLPAAFAVTRVLRIALIGVSPVDPLAFLLSVLALLSAAILGCLVPARRAMRVDPIVALRYE